MTLFVQCFLGFSSRLGGTSRFAFTFAYTRSFWLLEGVSTVKIFSSENQVRLILFWVIRFFKRLQAFNHFSLSAAVRDWTSRRWNTLSCKSFLAILTTDERESPVSLAISRGLLSFLAADEVTNQLDVWVSSRRTRTTATRQPFNTSRRINFLYKIIQCTPFPLSQWKLRYHSINSPALFSSQNFD